MFCNSKEITNEIIDNNSNYNLKWIIPIIVVNVTTMMGNHSLIHIYRIIYNKFIQESIIKIFNWLYVYNLLYL